MTIDVEIGGRVRSVRVEPIDPANGGRDGRFLVFVDDEEARVSIRQTELGLSLVFAGGRVLDAALTERSRGEWLVQLPHVGLVAGVGMRGRQRLAASPGAVGGEQLVAAPMPGRVLRVLVGVGDLVAERQGLVVVEAMKMENEIGSPKAGRVKVIAVSEGLSIEAGRLLAIVE